MAQEISKDEEKVKELSWWRTPFHYKVYNAVTEGKSIPEISEEIGIGNAAITSIIQNPYFVKKFQSFLFDGALTKAVIKIQLVREFWKNLKGRIHESENKFLLNQFIRLLSEREVKGLVSQEFMALIVATRDKTEQMSDEEKEAKVKEQLDYEEVEFKEKPSSNNGTIAPNHRVDNPEPPEDEQGPAD